MDEEKKFKLVMGAILLSTIAIIITVVLSEKYLEHDGFLGMPMHSGAKKMPHKGKFIGGINRVEVESQLLGQNGWQYWQRQKAHEADKEGYMSDAYHWPTSGQFGNMSDTNPYGNYAGHADLYYPIYNDQNAYWWTKD